MNKNKIYNLVYSLPLSIDQKDTLYKALSQGDNTEVETKLAELKKQVDAIKVPTKATKDVAGTVNAMSNIVNLDVETATLASVVGALNTLLVNLRSAGIIQV